MLVLLLPLTFLVPQPEVIGDHQPRRHNPDTAYQEDALPFLTAKPLGLLHLALRQTGGDFG